MVQLKTTEQIELIRESALIVSKGRLHFGMGVDLRENFFILTTSKHWKKILKTLNLT